jgi:hypothetical protein
MNKLNRGRLVFSYEYFEDILKTPWMYKLMVHTLYKAQIMFTSIERGGDRLIIYAVSPYFKDDSEGISQYCFQVRKETREENDKLHIKMFYDISLYNKDRSTEILLKDEEGIEMTAGIVEGEIIYDV